MRAVEMNAEYLGVTRLILMENAGKSVANAVMDVSKPGKKIVIACGTGGNGGDGFVAARHLAHEGFDVEVHLLGRPENITSDETSVNWRILKNMDESVKIREIRDSSEIWDLKVEVIVDALAGLASEPVQREYLTVISPQRRRGYVSSGRSRLRLENQQLPPLQVRSVIINNPLLRQVSPHANHVPCPLDLIGHREHKGISTIAIAGKQQTVTSLRFLQCRYQQHQWKGGSCVAHDVEQRVLHLCLRVNAQLLRKVSSGLGIGGGKDDLGKVVWSKIGLLQQCAHRICDGVMIPLGVAKPVLPCSGVGVAFASPYIVDLFGYGV